MTGEPLSEVEILGPQWLNLHMALIDGRKAHGLQPPTDADLEVLRRWAIATRVSAPLLDLVLMGLAYAEVAGDRITVSLRNNASGRLAREITVAGDIDR